MPVPSNLPPGVSENMIPGNRPEELAEEQWWNDFEEKVNKADLAIPAMTWDEPWFVGAVNLAKEMGYEEGYIDGRQEERQSSD